jgi:hypothetical protein
VSTSEKIHCISITRASWIMLFREITVYCENYVRHINMLCGQSAQFFNVKACFRYWDKLFSIFMTLER